MRVRISAVVLISLLTGCASGPLKIYEGPERDAGEVALITNTVNLAKSAIPFAETGLARLISIDGKSNNSQWGYHSAWDSNLNVALLPGEHSLTVVFHGHQHRTTMRSVEPVTFTINAEKGHVYNLSYLKTDSKWTPVLTDITVQKQVYPPINP